METQIIQSTSGVKLAKKMLDSKRATQQAALVEYGQNKDIQSAVKKLKERNELRGTPVITQI